VDRFCLPEACLIADLIDYCKKKRVSFDPTYLYNDVFKALNHIHSSGELHNEITSNLPKYLERSNFLGQFLERLRAAGKKIFLLTNSPFPFVDAGMKHLLVCLHVYTLLVLLLNRHIERELGLVLRCDHCASRQA
jgi:hypothetical protein